MYHVSIAYKLIINSYDLCGDNLGERVVVKIENFVLPCSNAFENLDVVLDTEFRFSKHVYAVC